VAMGIGADGNAIATPIPMIGKGTTTKQMGTK
jgi:hypothetical protein